MSPEITNREQKRACPLCSKRKARYLGSLCATLFENNPLPSYWKIMSCDCCNFIFCDGDYSQTTLEEYYSTEGDYWKDANVLFDPVADREDNPYVLLRKYLKANDTSILDVGCGSGKLLRKFLNNGFTNLYGTDLGYEEENNILINYRRGDITDIPFDNHFDLVISTHVLEHVYDVESAVASLVSQIRKGGMLYIEVPDTERYFSGNFTHIVAAAYEHINFFTSYNLIQLLARYNMTAVECIRTQAKYGLSEVPCIAIIAIKQDAEKSAISTQSISCAGMFQDALGQIGTDFSARIPDLIGKKIYVWGITRYLQVAMHYLGINMSSLCGLIDSSPARRKYTIEGVPSIAPEMLTDVADDAVILINAFNAVQPIKQQLRNMNFQGAVYSIW